MKSIKFIKISAVVGVVWYAFGLLQFWLGYAMDTGAAIKVGAITPEHAAAIDSTPVLVWLSFALASGAGLIGAALLFLGSAQAKPAFLVSLMSATIYYVWVYGLSGTGGARPSEELVIAGFVIMVTIIFNMISRRAT